FAFAEGTGNDWISLATIDRHHVAPAVGTLVFAVFLSAMTTARWFGPAALDRFGRVPVVRFISALADDPAFAAPRVGVVTTIGYCAFLGGPPLIGFLGQQTTVPYAMVAVIAAMLLAGAIAGCVRPPRTAVAPARRPGIEQ